jgi:hypothetical protein
LQDMIYVSVPYIKLHIKMHLIHSDRPNMLPKIKG